MKDKPNLTSEEVAMIIGALYARQMDIKYILSRATSEDIKQWCEDRIKILEDLLKKIGEELL
jgi:Trk K+ transport system NAD-binding subunit